MAKKKGIFIINTRIYSWAFGSNLPNACSLHLFRFISPPSSFLRRQLLTHLASRLLPIILDSVSTHLYSCLFPFSVFLLPSNNQQLLLLLLLLLLLVIFCSTIFFFVLFVFTRISSPVEAFHGLSEWFFSYSFSVLSIFLCFKKTRIVCVRVSRI